MFVVYCDAFEYAFYKVLLLSYKSNVGKIHRSCANCEFIYNYKTLPCFLFFSFFKLFIILPLVTCCKKTASFSEEKTTYGCDKWNAIGSLTIK